MKENLEGKVCLITGATNGIGEEAAKEIGLMGADICFVARNNEKAEKLKKNLESLTGREATAIIADLSSQAEVKKAAGEFLALNKPLHMREDLNIPVNKYVNLNNYIGYTGIIKELIQMESVDYFIELNTEKCSLDTSSKLFGNITIEDNDLLFCRARNNFGLKF